MKDRKQPKGYSLDMQTGFLERKIQETERGIKSLTEAHGECKKAIRCITSSYQYELDQYRSILQSLLDQKK